MISKPIWIHAVDLGEVRSAVPLIRALLLREEKILLTVLTVDARSEASRVFAAEIAEGVLCLVWKPVDPGWTYRRLFSAFNPKICVMLEIQCDPDMVAAARAHGVPIYMGNAQKTENFPVLHSMAMRHLTGAFVKSEIQKEKFLNSGVRNIQVTGELRFDQPIPSALVAAGEEARRILAGKRFVIAISSVMEPEEDVFMRAIEELLSREDKPFIVLVPRSPERFDTWAEMLSVRGIRFARRSQIMDARMNCQEADIDLLLGDSLGEMYGFISMSDRVVVGGGFSPKGSHNIIEALALGRPAIIGPHIFTIEYPAREALAAGVCLQSSADTLAKDLMPDGWSGPDKEIIDRFLKEHTGSTQRSVDAILRACARKSISAGRSSAPD